MAYIDTSVLAAYYCPEPLSRSVQRALATVKEPVISPLVEVEFYSAIAAKVRRRELEAAWARQILAMFRGHIADGWYGMVPIETEEYSIVRDWLGRFTSPLRAPDALHLAAALANDLTLLTADKNLSRSAGIFKVRCKLVG